MEFTYSYKQAVRIHFVEAVFHLGCWFHHQILIPSSNEDTHLFLWGQFHMYNYWQLVILVITFISRGIRKWTPDHFKWLLNGVRLYVGSWWEIPMFMTFHMNSCARQLSFASSQFVPNSVTKVDIQAITLKFHLPNVCDEIFIKKHFKLYF